MRPGYAAALKQRERLPEELRGRYRPFPFLREEMADALVAADLLVGRAGSSTLAEASAIGLPMVVVPYPHAGGHQEANARELVEAGAAELVPDEDVRRRRARGRLRLLADPATLRADARPPAGASAGPAPPRATGELLLALGERRALPAGAIAGRAVLAGGRSDRGHARPAV